MSTLRAILQLTRADSSLMAFLCLFIPIYARTSNLGISIGRAIPLLFICMCTFIANDLSDLERDEVNHPGRPLPSRRLVPATAAITYFGFLAIALFLTRYFVEQHIAFWYYALMTLSISYSYIVEWLPTIKAPYVAAAISIPVCIVAASYPEEKRLQILVVAGFLFALGRELCMDIADRAGDIKSPIHRIPAEPVAIAAFIVQIIGIGMLIVQIRQPLDVIAVVFMAVVLATCGVFWFSLKNLKTANRLMKLQLLVGLYFLA